MATSTWSLWFTIFSWRKDQGFSGDPNRFEETPDVAPERRRMSETIDVTLSPTYSKYLEYTR